MLHGFASGSDEQGLSCGQNIVFGPAHQVQTRAVRQKVETGLRHFSPPFALEPDFEFGHATGAG
jgi:hypothetical protein